MNSTNQILWSKSKKFWFLIIFFYFAFFSFPFPLDALMGVIQRFLTWVGELSGIKMLTTVNDGIDTFFGYWEDLWKWLIPAISTHILHIAKPITVFTNGSGDTTFDWLMMSVKFVFAILFAFTFLKINKSEELYSRLYNLLILVIRYYLIFIMLRYGFAKVVQTQFPQPRLTRLMQPYGESSPMGLAWTFIGSSKGYSFFTGTCEVVAAFLLFFRRTKTFGALFTMTVCFTIFVMNLCYDIPVKLFSFHLFLLATFIACDDFSRLIGFFFTNQKVEPYEMKSYFEGHSKFKYLTGLKYFLLGFWVYTNYTGSIKRDIANAEEKKFSLYGIHNIAYRTINNDTIPLLYKSESWKNLIINTESRGAVQLLNDSTQRFTFKVDSIKRTIDFKGYTDTLQKYNFKYTYKNKSLRLEGKMKNDNVVMGFNRKDETKFLLNSRGFHWVNEEPYNR
jgi:hypothetical protein